MTSQMGNIMSRLGGLKNVSKRRVIPGAEFLEELNPVDTDVSETAQTMPDFSKFLPQNAPVSTQENDVRANQVMLPEPPKEEPGFMDELKSEAGKFFSPSTETSKTEEPGFFTRLGQAFSGLAKPQELAAAQPMQPRLPLVTPEKPPIETAQVDVSENLPPVTASQQVVNQASSPELSTSIETSDSGQLADQEPGSYAVQGAAKEALSNPQIKAEYERIFNTPINQEVMSELETWEKVLAGYNKSAAELQQNLTEREKKIKDRIDSRALSPQDQVLMAMALIAPALLIGATMGKEAGIGALGGGAGGLAKVLARHEDELRKDEEKLDELALEKLGAAGQQLKGAAEVEKMKAKALEKIPNRVLRDIVNRDGYINKDGKFVLNSGNPLLPIKIEKVRDEKDLENLKNKELPKLEENLAYTQDAKILADQMHELLDYAEQQEKSGVGGLLRKYNRLEVYDSVAKAIKAYVPYSRDEFIDENGNKIKYSSLYGSYLDSFMDVYNRMLSGGNLTEAKQAHYRRELPNPFDVEAFKQGLSSLPQAKKQLEIKVKQLEDHFLHTAEAKGIDTSNIKNSFSESKINKKQSESARIKKRQEAAVQQTLGKK